MHSEPEPPLEGTQPEGRYANQFKVGHNFFEFVIDFGQSYGEDGAVKYHTRMVTNPVYAKSLLKLLAESVSQYEQNFGAIVDREPDATGFRG